MSADIDPRASRSRRAFLAATALAPFVAQAQAVAGRVIVPYAPGAATDTLGRIMADLLSASVGTKYIVENRADGRVAVRRGAIPHDRLDTLPLQLGHDRFKCAGARKRAHVQLVQHVVAQRQAAPGGVLPGVRQIADHGRAVYALGLLARGGIRTLALAVEHVQIARPWLYLLRDCAEVPLPAWLQRLHAVFVEQLHRNAAGGWRPDMK